MLSQLRPKRNAVDGKGVTLVCGLLLLTLQYATNVSAAEKKIELQWLGHSAFKIVSLTGKVIVIDPFLSNNPNSLSQYTMAPFPY